MEHLDLLKIDNFEVFCNSVLCREQKKQKYRFVLLKNKLSTYHVDENLPVGEFSGILLISDTLTPQDEAITFILNISDLYKNVILTNSVNEGEKENRIMIAKNGDFYMASNIIHSLEHPLFVITFNALYMNFGFDCKMSWCISSYLTKTDHSIPRKSNTLNNALFTNKPQEKPFNDFNSLLHFKTYSEFFEEKK